MCCFSRPVRFVGGTRIFARAAGDDRQHLAYAMQVDFDEPLAMVLPLPVPAGVPDDAVAFVALDGYATLFDDLEAAFPPDYSAMPQARGPVVRAPPQKPLVVHDVGMFEASFVPTRGDFARLDPRFRLPDTAWSGLGAYADWGFAVFRLKPAKRGFLGFGTSRQKIHPMALTFPRRDPRALFFPTVHVHDGATVPERAGFDHMLFCQADGVLDATLDWARSAQPLGAHVRGDARGLVDVSAPGRRASMWGPQRNADVWLRAPDDVTVDDLAGRGEMHAYAVRATSAFAHDTHGDPRRVAWQATAQRRLGRLARGLRDGLRELTAARRDAWRLCALDDRLAAHFVNGTQLWTGTSYMDGAPARAGVPGRVAMKIFTDQVEPQDITLAFASLPDPPALDGIRAELGALVDRAARG